MSKGKGNRAGVSTGRERGKGGGQAAGRPAATSTAQALTVGEVAARSGVAVSALHFYESKGLIHSERNAGNQRRFAREVLRRVAVIKVAQRVGVPLAEIRAALGELPNGRTPTAADWNRLSARWKAQLDERIGQLMLLRDQLSGCIGCGCLSMQACPLRNPGDQLSEQGPGPRLMPAPPEAAAAPVPAVAAGCQGSCPGAVAGS